MATQLQQEKQEIFSLICAINIQEEQGDFSQSAIKATLREILASFVATEQASYATPSDLTRYSNWVCLSFEDQAALYVAAFERALGFSLADRFVTRIGKQAWLAKQAASQDQTATCKVA